MFFLPRGRDSRYSCTFALKVRPSLAEKGGVIAPDALKKIGEVGIVDLFLAQEGCRRLPIVVAGPDPGVVG
jgi:hypothetical protein